MTSRIKVNPRLAADLQRSAQYRAMLEKVGGQVAADAESIPPGQFAYRVEVRVNGNTVEVRGSAPVGEGIRNIGGFVEFGADQIPAYAPLRTAADRNGLKVERR